MKRTVLIALSLGLAASSALAQFTPGRVVVLQVNGTTSAGNSGTLVEYNPTVANGSPTYSVALPYNNGVDNGNNIVFDPTQYTAVMSRSGDGAFLVIPGYANTYSSLNSSTAANANRVIAVVKYDGTFVRKVTSSTAFSGTTIRSAAGDGFNNFWAGGGGQYTWYLGTNNAAMQVQSIVSATRNLICVDGKLYTPVNSSGGGYGVVGWDTLPISNDGGPYLKINVNVAGNNAVTPIANSVAVNGNVAYIADMRTAANGGGIQRWEYDGSTWNRQYVIATPGGATIQNTAVDFSGAQPVIYLTTSTGNALWAVTDTGSGTSTSLQLATPSAGSFKGVALAPVVPPTPSAFTLQPAGVTNDYGATVSFQVEATGANPYAYTWTRSGTNLVDGPTGTGSVISGASSNVLTIANISKADEMFYYAVAHNNGPGTLTSAGAYLKIAGSCINPQITSAVVVQGGSAQFTAGTSLCQTPLAFSWYFNDSTSPIANGGGWYGEEFAGATTSTLTINNVQMEDTGTYKVTVIDGAGQPSSSVATLTVCRTPTFIVNPVDQDKVQGQTASFTVVADGNAISYYWYKNDVAINDGPTGSGSVLAGTHTASLWITNVMSADQGTYTCLASNVAGTATSNPGLLTVGVIPVVSPLTSLTNLVGATAAFSAAVTAGTPPFTYTWKHYTYPLSHDGEHYFNLDPLTLSVANLITSDAGPYTLTVANKYGSMTVAAQLYIVTDTSHPNETPGLILYETFNYPYGPLPGSNHCSWENIISTYNRETGEPAFWINTGNGLYSSVGTWPQGDDLWHSVARNGGGLPEDTAGGLYPYPGLECANQNRWGFSSSGANAHLHFGGVSTGTVYFSFIFTGDQGSEVNNGTYDVVAGFTSGNSDALGNNANSFAYALCTKADDAPGENNPGNVDGRGGWRFGVFKGGGINIGPSSANGQWAPLHCWRGHPYLIVGCYKIVSGGTTATDDVLSLWVEPPVSSFGANEANVPPPSAGGMVTNWGVNAPLTEFCIRATLNTSPFSKAISDLRIGRTWASVTKPYHPTLNMVVGPTATTLSWPLKDSPAFYGYQLSSSSDLMNWTRGATAHLAPPGFVMSSDGTTLTATTNSPIAAPQFWRLEYPRRTGAYWAY